jgi:hypothetical protein
LCFIGKWFGLQHLEYSKLGIGAQCCGRLSDGSDLSDESVSERSDWSNPSGRSARSDRRHFSNRKSSIKSPNRPFGNTSWALTSNS